MSRYFMVLMVLMALLMLTVSAGMADTGYEWAVMVYMCGSDLESGAGMATEDIFEMMAGEMNGRACFVVQTGGSEEWQTDVVDPYQLERYLVESESGAFIGSFGQGSMGKESTLADFVRWTMSNVSASHYGLILWNHGSGSISGVCFDELYDYDSLSLEELSGALSGIPKLDFIGFDACLMATYETAAILADHADYMIASEESEPGYGWNYTEIGSALGRGVSAPELGRIICDSFYEMCEEIGEEDVCTLSVVDLSKIAGVTKSLDKAAAAMSGMLSKPEYVGGLSRGIAKAENYGGNNAAEGYTNMIDLGDLMNQVSASVPEAGECLKAIRSAVVYQVHGSRRSHANGLSVYYPLSVQGSEEMKIFERVNPSAEYVYFVKNMLYGSVTGEVESFPSDEAEAGDFFSLWDLLVATFQEGGAQYATQITFAEEPYLDEDGWYVFRLDEDCLDNVQSVRMSLWQYLYEDETTYYLGDDININADWETGEFWDNFNGTWPSLPDNQELMFYILEEDDEYILYSAPILLNGEEMYLRFAWVWDDPYDYENEYGEYVVIDAWDGIGENGITGRGHAKIRNGDIITPIYYGWDDYSDEAEDYYGQDYTVRDELIIEDLQLREGLYDYCFEIIDIWGNSITTDSTLFYVNEYGEVEY